VNRKKQEILKDLAAAVVEMDEEKAVKVAWEVLAAKIDAYEAIVHGFSKGMEVVGDKYERGEYFVPEVLLCSDAMCAGMEVLKPYLRAEAVKLAGKVVIGVVEGDTHDIGKNIVKVMMETAGFEVFDLGRNVPLSNFIDKAIEFKADIIGLSTLMTTTMEGMRNVIEMVKTRGLRNGFKVMIGGAPISQSFADTIGADAYASNAAAAVRVAKKLLEERMP